MTQDSSHNPSNSGEMPTLTLPDPTVVVLADGASKGATDNARGHLFEKFVAHLFHMYGYSQPSIENSNVTADGIELDVVATHEISRQEMIAECKAYSSPVSAAMLGTFHSKLVTRRYKAPNTQGYFVALPRLTANGKEQADEIAANDAGFKLLTARGVVDLLRSKKFIVECPITNVLSSDPAVIISEHGVYAACLEVDDKSRTPSRVLIWAVDGLVPSPVLESLSRDKYAQGATVVDARDPHPPVPEQSTDFGGIIVAVTGSQSDFEYQLPASPKYFVGRKSLIASLEESVDSHVGAIVLNAQSGWGKSSAALRLQALVQDRRGYASIIDSRTASHRRFVSDALRVAALNAEEAGVLELGDDASWASLPSSLRTLKDALWSGGPLVVFFDQFENVFRDEALTREFRDLALSARDLSEHLLVGFAWKTDLIGWTENHPYQLRDEIRTNATVLTLGPLGVSEVDTLLRRLEKALGQSIARDLKTRLREYSQGLPWLFKKLAGHLLREVKAGATQEQLANEALNIQNLFDADLAELGPVEQDGLRYIARWAPIGIGEVMERVSTPIVETLINRRLVVQVGARLDTYWDIFRDYLNNGRVPVEDSYILRQSPVSVARLLKEVLADGGDSSVRRIAERLGTSENGVFNLSRELRLLGATSYEPNKVRLLPEIWESDDREQELRRRVSSSLRRHRSYSTFVTLVDRQSEVTIQTYADALPTAFPAVYAKPSTWVGYARVHLQWFEYAGLAKQKGTTWSLTPEGTIGTGQLLGGQVVHRMRGGFPHDAAGPSLNLLTELGSGQMVTKTRAVRSLEIIGCVRENADGSYSLTQPDLVVDGAVVPERLHQLLVAVPGVPEGLAVIESNPAARPEEVGEAVRQALSAEWAVTTTKGIGKHLRSWARAAGIPVK